ncbi:MAG: FtsX-like permease family protein, partial [Verrucomicrobiae bacterium]|nr:FtsX-like permease family protein [Verrucomicrobiae bacterium]
VRRLLVGEGAAIAALGTVLGIWAGTAYAQGMVHGLSSIWRDAVGGTPLGYHLNDGTLAIGGAAAWIVAVLTLWWALRRQAARPARELLNEGNTAFDFEDGLRVSRSGHVRPKRRWSGVVTVLAFLGALGSAGSAFFAGDNAAAGAFFGAGALLLIAGLAGATAGLQRLGRSDRASRLSLGALGLRGLTRRRRRSVATMALLASATFLIASIGVFRLEMPDDVSRRDSGTGGFSLVGSATQPVLYDLTSQEACDRYALADDLWEQAGVVSFRVRDGEEASCLNLNRAQTPRVLGVKPEELAGRRAFRFAQLMKGLPRSLGWEALDRVRCAENGLTLEADEVPVIGDAASIKYALGNRVGGTLDYRDNRGRVFKLRIVGAVANSILQGNLIMAESEFVQRFPDDAGYRWFLIDAPATRREALARELTRSLGDLGFEVTQAASRLAAFNAVQNTYLGTFQVLGGLGLLLGSFGLGAVVLRNVLERRSELALMQALGFLPAALRQLVLREHLLLLGGGLGIGVVAATIAVLPTVLLTGLPVPWWSLGATLLAVLLNGALWTWLATLAALRGGLLTALRND